MRDHDLWLGSGVDRHTIDGVSARRIATIGPVENAVFQIELEVDWFRQTIEQHLDVGAVRRGLALRDLEVGAEDAALSAVVGTLLRPVEVPPFGIDGDSDAPPILILPFLVAAACLDQRFNVRSIKVGAHHAHALAITPVELPALLFEMHLLRSIGHALWNDDLAIPPIEVGAFD